MLNGKTTGRGLCLEVMTSSNWSVHFSITGAAGVLSILKASSRTTSTRTLESGRFVYLLTSMEDTLEYDRSYIILLFLPSFNQYSSRWRTTMRFTVDYTNLSPRQPFSGTCFCWQWYGDAARFPQLDQAFALYEFEDCCHDYCSNASVSVRVRRKAFLVGRVLPGSVLRLGGNREHVQPALNSRPNQTIADQSSFKVTVLKKTKIKYE